jgi:predicted aspartyl protease
MPTILGTFKDGAPFMVGHIVPLGLEAPVSGNVEFLVDTGAHRTCLHPRDAIALGMDLTKLEYAEPSWGIGGTAYYSPLDAHVIFFHGDLQVEKVEVLVAQPTNENMGLPSLLGRDIINRWTMVYAPRSNKLQFEA